MFTGYLARPELLPPGYRVRVAAEVGWLAASADYLAGMTDRLRPAGAQRLFAGRNRRLFKRKRAISPGSLSEGLFSEWIEARTVKFLPPCLSRPRWGW